MWKRVHIDKNNYRVFFWEKYGIKGEVPEEGVNKEFDDYMITVYRARLKPVKRVNEEYEKILKKYTIQ